jgi:two-component system OmpR family sensor kinase
VSPLRTVSLHRRVTLTTLLVLAIVLVVLGFVVNAVFRAQAERDVNGLLAGRVQLAQQLAKQNVTPANLVRRVETRGIRASLTLPNGERLGAPSQPPDSEYRQVKAKLNGPARINGAELVLSADTALLAGAERSLRQVLLITGLCAIVVTAFALLIGVRFALAPLEAMTRLAKSIVSGGRGGRLAPTHANTDLGRTATAFDEMLDALEGAEMTARSSEERTRLFLADAAHELRTPIAGVQAAAEAVLQQAPDADPEQRERLQLLLVRESRRAGKLVGDLLELARLDAGAEVRREPVRLLTLAESQADRVRLLAPDLRVDVTGTETEVLGDSDRITQILANLADNARHAMGGAGTLTLAVARSGRFAEVLVTDTGPGVPPPDRERIFHRLVRLDEARDRSSGGSGLGLPIARGFARAHGGELEYRDRPDGQSGAVFRLLLPLGDLPAEPFRPDRV